MKKFLLLAFAAMLSNPAVCMENDDKLLTEMPMWRMEDGTIVLLDHMEVVRKRFDCRVGFGAVSGATLFAKSVYEGNVFLGSISAALFLSSAYLFTNGEARITLHADEKKIDYGSVMYGAKGIGDMQKQIDNWNKLRSENPAAAQEVKNKIREVSRQHKEIREIFRQHKEKNAKKVAPSEDASEQSE